MNRMLPVTLVTGFLGAGKTTIIGNLLKPEKEKRVALLVGEFGDVSIDDIILRNSTDERVEVHRLSNRLVTSADDSSLIETLLSIHARRHLFDHVIIETSGVALPTQVLQSLQNDSLKEAFVLDATLAIVDTPWLLQVQGQSWQNANECESQERLFLLQLKASDVVVLNKIDNLTDEELFQAEVVIRTFSPDSRFLELAHQGTIDNRVALGLRLNQPASGLALQIAPHVVSVGSTNRSDGHSHSGLSNHDHGILTHEHLDEHDPGWMSFVLRSNDYMSAELLASTLQKIATTQPLFRVKGFIHALEAEPHCLVQGVRDRILVGAFLEDHDHSFESAAAEDNVEHHRNGHHQHSEHRNRNSQETLHSHLHESERSLHEVALSSVQEHHHKQDHHHDHDHQDHYHDHHHEHLAELVFIGYHLDREEVLKAINSAKIGQWF